MTNGSGSHFFPVHTAYLSTSRTIIKVNKNNFVNKVNGGRSTLANQTLESTQMKCEEGRMSLTPIEKNNLVELEATIEKNLKSFYEVGFALMQIRDNKLYRENYITFEHYCKEKWKMTRVRAHQLISAAEVQDDLLTTVNIPERQLRPLVPVKDPEERREVYQRAIDTAPNGKVTAKHIEETVKETQGIKHTETYPVSDAMTFAGIAISQLERIRDDDPLRKEAIQKVFTWCSKNI
jgi:DNA-directed RNA polymerase subunit H (RpoH/RPB5)